MGLQSQANPHFYFLYLKKAPIPVNPAKIVTLQLFYQKSFQHQYCSLLLNQLYNLQQELIFQLLILLCTLVQEIRSGSLLHAYNIQRFVATIALI